MDPEREYLVDGQYSFRDLVDIDQLREMFERFSQATGFTTGLVSYPDQELLIGTGWRDICTKFHRASPVSEVHCKRSNLELTSQLTERKALNICHCESGLVDGATPIVIKGAHVANLSTGQILFEEPDVERFRKQGETYGYDVEAYIEALEQVPVVTEEAFKKALSFLSDMAVMLAEQGLTNLRNREATQAVHESEERFRGLVESSSDWIWEINTKGVFTYASPRVKAILGYEPEEISGKSLFDLMPPEEAKRIGKTFIALMARSEPIVTLENTAVHKDGRSVVLETSGVPVLDTAGKVTGYRGVARDITERKQREIALRESETRFRTIIDANKDAMIVIDQRGMITLFNSAAESMFGRRAENMLGQPVNCLMPASFRSQHTRDIASFFATGEPDGVIGRTVEVPAVRADGKEFPIEISLAGGGIGNQAFVVSVIRDITERKRAEEALRRSEENLRTTLNSIGDAVIATDVTGAVTRVNPVAEQLTGWTVEEARGMPLTEVFDVVNARTGEPAENPVARVIESSQIVGLANHTMLIAKDGTAYQIADSGAPIRDAAGTVTGVVLVFRDVTDEYRMREAVRESEALLGRSQAIAHIGSWELDLIANRLTWSDEVYRIFGLRPREFDGTHEAFLDAVHPDDRAAVDAAYSESLREGADNYEIEHRIVRRDSGEVRSVHEKCEHVRDASGRIVRSVGMVQDITDRKRAEAERREHLHFLESLDQINRAIQQEDDVEQMLWGVIGTIFSIFEADRAWLMYPCDPLAPTFRIPMEVTRPEYPGGFALELEIPMHPDSGKVCTIALASNEPVTFGPDCDHPLYLEASAPAFEVKSWIVMGIRPKVGKPWLLGMHQCSHPRIWTPQERRLFAEIGRRIGDALSTRMIFADLRQSEERMELALRGADLGTWDWNLHTGDVTFNERWAEMLGYALEDIEPHQITWDKLIHPDDMPHVDEILNAHLQGKTYFFETEHRLRHKSGDWVWVLNRGRVIERDADGKPLRACGTHLDINDRKRAEAALLSEKLLSEEYINSLPGLFYVFDENRFVRWNKEWLRITGYSDEELGAMYGTDFFEGDDKVLIGERMAKVFREGFADAEAEFVTKDGRRIPYYFTGLRKAFNGKDHLVGLGIDITERKQAEEALRESEERHRTIYETAAEGIVIADMETRKFRYANPAICRMFGYTAEEFGQLGVPDIHPEPDLERIIGEFRAIERGEKSFTLDIPCLRKDGTVFPADISAGIARFERRLCAVGFFTDITERKQAEVALQSQMETQKLLLRELDHRVRNNLSSLISLIDLSRAGAGSIDDLASAMRSRTQAIAAMHSFLSSSQWLGGDLEGMLTMLVHPLRRTRIRVEGPGTLIPLGQAQALGLVINELATNSIKYGAMSADNAAVDITWTTRDSERGAAELTLLWKETDGPAIKTQPTPGTGANLIIGLTQSELRGYAELTYPPEGAVHTLHITLTADATAQFDQPSPSPA